MDIFKNIKKYFKKKKIEIIKEKIRKIKKENIYFLEIEWKLKKRIGKSIIFKTSDIKENERKIIKKIIKKINNKEELERYNLKKQKEYTFFYYTIK